MNHDDLGPELGQMGGLLYRGIPATDDHQHLVAVYGEGAVTYGAGGNALLPVAFLTGDAQAAGRGAGGQNQGLGQGFPAGGHHPEGTPAQIHLLHRLRKDTGAETQRLLTKKVHHLGSVDALGETRIVFDIVGRGQLTAGRHAACHESLEHQGREIGPRRINGGRMPRGTRPHNYKFLDLI